MTSREYSQTRCHGKLDGLIRWTLRDSVAGASPPPSAWWGIADRVRRQQVDVHRGQWREIRLAFRSAAIWLLNMAGRPPRGLAYAGCAECGRTREKYELFLLMYQQDLAMLLGQVL